MKYIKFLIFTYSLINLSHGFAVGPNTGIQQSSQGNIQSAKKILLNHKTAIITSSLGIAFALGIIALQRFSKPNLSKIEPVQEPTSPSNQLKITEFAHWPFDGGAAGQMWPYGDAKSREQIVPPLPLEIQVYIVTFALGLMDKFVDMDAVRADIIVNQIDPIQSLAKLEKLELVLPVTNNFAAASKGSATLVRQVILLSKPRFYKTIMPLQDNIHTKKIELWQKLEKELITYRDNRNTQGKTYRRIQQLQGNKFWDSVYVGLKIMRYTIPVF